MLPDDEVCEQNICFLEDIKEDALIIKRFDRYTEDGVLKRIHFEEFNQLLNNLSEQKYDSTYEKLAEFIYSNSDRCDQKDVLKLFKRILVFILIGNTDAHLKNFAMFHNENGSMSLTPIYDAVASAFYKRFDTIALKLSGKEITETKLSSLKPKHIVNFALNKNGFRLSHETLSEIIQELETRKDMTLDMLSKLEQPKLDKVKSRLIVLINTRWNGTFKGIESFLTKKNKKYSEN